MLSAISFNDEAALHACEVRNASADRLLLLELETAEPTIAQVIPQAAFGVGGIASKRACMRIDSADCCHNRVLEEAKPSPNPLPHAGEDSSGAMPGSSIPRA